MTYPFRHRSWNSKKLQVVRLHRHFKLVSDFSFCSCLAGHKAFKTMLPTTVSFPKHIQSVHFPLADSAFWPSFWHQVEVHYHNWASDSDPRYPAGNDAGWLRRTTTYLWFQWKNPLASWGAWKGSAHVFWVEEKGMDFQGCLFWPMCNKQVSMIQFSGIGWGESTKKIPSTAGKPSSLDHIASKQHRVYPVKAFLR